MILRKPQGKNLVITNKYTNKKIQMVASSLIFKRTDVVVIDRRSYHLFYFGTVKSPIYVEALAGDAEKRTKYR
jgi:hypothetical protein